MQVYSLPAMNPLLVMHSDGWSHTKQINHILAGNALPGVGQTFFTASDDSRVVGFKIDANLVTGTWPEEQGGGGGY